MGSSSREQTVFTCRFFTDSVISFGYDVGSRSRVNLRARKSIDFDAQRQKRALRCIPPINRLSSGHRDRPNDKNSNSEAPVWVSKTLLDCFLLASKIYTITQFNQHYITSIIYLVKKKKNYVRMDYYTRKKHKFIFFRCITFSPVYSEEAASEVNHESG